MKNYLRALVQAARLPAHGLIFLPLFVGELLYYQIHPHQKITWSLIFFAHLWGLFYQIYLLFINDYFDREVDARSTKFFLSGGSRVLPDGKLVAKDLWRGSHGALLFLMASVGILVFKYKQYELIYLSLGALFLAFAYSAPPFRFSYKGWGEITQGLFGGVFLPLLGFAFQAQAQAHSLLMFPPFLILYLFVLFYTANLVTALPDAESDSLGGKMTLVVQYGGFKARVAILFLFFSLTILLIFLLSDWGLLTWSIFPLAILTMIIPFSQVYSGEFRSADAQNNWEQCVSFVRKSIGAIAIYFLAIILAILLKK
jgi:1,4-dihydroxy-2-naphthoate octaprenyltransferase